MIILLMIDEGRIHIMMFIVNMLLAAISIVTIPFGLLFCVYMIGVLMKSYTDKELVRDVQFSIRFSMSLGAVAEAVFCVGIVLIAIRFLMTLLHIG